MYILFINLGGKWDIYFLLNLIIILIKKTIQPMGSTQPNPIHVGLNPCDGLSWIFFFNLPWGVGSKNPLDPT